MATIPAMGHQVLLLWSPLSPQEQLIETVTELKAAVGKDGKVSLECLDRLEMAAHTKSSFDVVICGTLTPTIACHSNEIFVEIARILKPGGTAIIRESVFLSESIPNLRNSSKLASSLRLSGFIDVDQLETVPLSKLPEHELLLTDNYLSNKVLLIEMKAKKPGYEIGSSVSIGKEKVSSKINSDEVRVLMISADDDDIELINEDDLLDEDDLKKPDPSSLRVCKTTQKRKACKNCTCGLAEELENEKTSNESIKNSNSACGNCYLGDAFRCSSCPYLGMPAFKPGEKISLKDYQLKADV